LNWTTEQRRVVEWVAGPMLVLAVAGAGKTTCLLGLIKRLLEAVGVLPRDILMTTFSKRGASDMAARACELRVPDGVGYRTLHSIGFEMVRSAGHRLRLDVPDGWKVSRVIREEIAEVVLEAKRAGQPLDSEGLPKIGEVQRFIGVAKANLIFPDSWIADGRVFPAFKDWLTERGESEVAVNVATRCYVALEEACKAPEAAGFDGDAGKRWITFDDQLAVAARAVLRKGAKDRWTDAWKGRYSVVLVDEVQDNNLAQWVLVQYLARASNLVAVGDDQQSIFGFRGASPSLMRDFRDAGAAVAPLSTNWRSGRKILEVGNRVLDTCTDRLYDGGLVAGRDADGCVDASEYTDEAEEARSVVADIASMIDEGQSPDSIAVLYRLNASSAAFEVELIRRGMPYRIAGSSFFNQGVVRSAIGYLACALDPEDVEGFRACYASPLRGLGREFVRRYPTVTEVRNGLGEMPQKWSRPAKKLLAIVDKVKELDDSGQLAEALRYLFEDVGLRTAFRDEAADPEDETEADAAATALTQCAAGMNGAADMLNFARAMLGREDHTGERSSRPMVTLSTVHKAKGLEWDTVFVTGMSAGLFPLRTGDPNEEKRLAYVAVTRPQNTLRVSWTRESNGRPAGPSSVAVDAGLREVAEGGAVVVRDRALAGAVA
jgi:DNA helicase II / ATP-dependent DNA helicase PcrA